MLTHDDCLFCKIVAEEIPADVVHASDHVLAFRDIAPKAPVHILLIPKSHIEAARDLTEKDAVMLGELFWAAAHLAKAEGIADRGFRLVTNSGDEGGQEVPHLHWHLLGGRQMGASLG